MKEIVTFFLSGKVYGVDVSRMQGIENYTEIMVSPDMPDCLQGAVMIRNEQIPVVDIKRRMVLPAVPVTAETKFLVLRTEQGKIAIVADGVSKILKAEGEEIQDFPALAQTDKTSYVAFIVQKENNLILTIDPDALLAEGEWEEIQKALEDIKTGGKND